MSNDFVMNEITRSIDYSTVMGNFFGTRNLLATGGVLNDINRGNIDKIQNYLINERAVIIWFKDGIKTVATCIEDDEFDKEFGFILAFYKYVMKKNDISKASYKRMLSYIKEENMKDYLLEAFNRQAFKNMDKSRKFLKNLKATGKKEKV